MSASLRDLRSHADGVTPPTFDVADILERGEARRRQHRMAIAAGAATMVVAVIAAGAALSGWEQRSDDPVDEPTHLPTNDPNPTDTQAPVPAPVPARPLTYTDDYTENWKGAGPRWLIHSIVYGDAVLPLDIDVMHMDVTDDGLALVAIDGGIHFADGSTVEQIGELTISVNFSDGGVKSDNAGSLVAWFTPARPDALLVVYDTRERAVVAREPVRGCTDFCQVRAVVGDRVYVTTDVDQNLDAADAPLLALDVSSGTVSDTDQSALSADIRTHPRGLVKSNSFANGEVGSGEENFVARGSALELRWLVRETGADVDGDGRGDGDVGYGYGGFDTTGRRLNLQLPDDYTPAASPYTLFQWLDDDRFAVMAGAVRNEFGWGGYPGYGDILVCDVSSGRCDLAAGGPGGDGFRLVPHLDVPN